MIRPLSTHALRAACLCAAFALALGCAGKKTDGTRSYGDARVDEVLIQDVDEPEPSLAEEVMAGDQLRDLGHESEAVFHYLRGLYLDSASPIPRQRVAFMQLSHDAPRGQRIFEKLIENHPDLSSAYLGRGLALIAQGNLQGAREPLLHAVELDPESTVALVALGLVSDRARDYTEAQGYYEAALAIEPNRYEVQNNLGVSRLMAEDYEGAVSAFREAAHIDPRDPAVYNNLGVALARMRLYREALESFRRSADDADAFNNLALVCHANGDYGLALTYYERALLLGPTNRDVVLANLEATEAAQLIDRIVR